MMILVTGGSCSGKSSFAEGLLAKTGEAVNKYYIATMDALDEESRARIQRHRTQRAGKGFVTVEQARNVHLAKLPFQGVRYVKSAALLECMSNLTANEMFGPGGTAPANIVVDKVCEEIALLAGRLDTLIIVTNNVFEDGREYDAGTESYLRALGEINMRLAARADQVYEVVVGIPISVR